ncbi:MAG: efflux RND transporter periplasmic adaptor subunit [Alistipes sp.]|nr:efflux RND transporter periplasmic adaptor subunit [Alistipes sp.]
MKYIFLFAAAAIFAACGSGNRNNSEVHYGHSLQSCDHDHHHGEDHCHEDSCGDHDHGHGHSHGEHSGHGHGDSGESCPDGQEIIFTAQQAALTDLAVSKAYRGLFREVIAAYGEVLPAPGDRVSIVAPSEGVVSFAGRAIADGAKVGQGATLFTVSSSNISGGDQFAVNRANLERARSAYERGQRLRDDNIVSQGEFDVLAAEYEAARIQFESLTEAGTGLGAAVSSPASGYIYGIRVGEGQFVEKGELLATVVRSRTMELRAEVPQRYSARVAGVTDANFSVPSTDRVLNIKELGGHLVSVGGVVDAASPAIPVLFRFPYNPEILAGTFAQVHLLGAVREEILTLPLSAITEQQGLHYVYIRNGDDSYMRCDV